MTVISLEQYWEGEVRPGAPAKTSPGDPYDVWSDPDVDWAPAFNRAFADVTSRRSLGAFPFARIDLTGRLAWHLWSPLTVRVALELYGAGSPHMAGLTRLLFHGCGGITVDAGTDAGGALRVGSLRASGLSIYYVGSAKDDPHEGRDGLRLHRSAVLRDVQIANFPGFGLYAEGTPATNRNVDRTQLDVVQVVGCGLTGVHLEGGDANVILSTGLDLIANASKHLPGFRYGLCDLSKLGNTHIAPHGRNNGEANFYVGNLGAAPSRTTIIDPYSEHGEKYLPQFAQPGPDIFQGNSLLITARGEGGSAGAFTSTPQIYSSLGRLYLQPVAQMGGANGVSLVAGDGTKRSPGDTSARPAMLAESSAYVGGIERFYPIVHDPLTNLWATKTGSPASQPAVDGVTDSRHARGGGRRAFPRGYLVGPRNLAVGTHDPRFEREGVGTPPTSAAASLHGVFPLASARTGDIVLNEMPGTAYPWLGWVCVAESVGVKSWRRFGEQQIGTIVPAGPPPPPSA